jgi:hypothetical protein
MSAGQVVAFVCYALAALLSLLFGTMYLVRSQFMPYHEEAVGIPWQQLDPRFQALLLGLLRTTGGGLLTAGICVAILLLIPFRGDEAWSRSAIPVIGLVSSVPALYATVLIRARTGARTPVAASGAAIGLILAGFVLSLF